MLIPAVRQTQNGTEVFQCALGKEILGDPKRVKADTYTPRNKSGYQREPTPSRVKAFASYLLEKGDYKDAGGVCANSLVLNSRTLLKFTPIQDNIGMLDLTDAVLWEVDGQHRIGGFQAALDEDSGKLADFTFPAVITNGLDRLQEALVFFLINTKQQRVQTDLCQRLISENLDQTKLGEALLAQGKDWQKEGLKVLDQLNEVQGQPWFKKIKTPGIDLGKTFVSQNTFLMSLRPILTSEPYRSMKNEDVVTLLTRYWGAIQSTLPECFVEGQQKNYAIQKTTGVGALHALFPAVVERARRRGTRITQDALEEILESVLEDGSEYWNVRNDQGASAFGSSHKGIRILVSRLHSKLPTEEQAILV